MLVCPTKEEARAVSGRLSSQEQEGTRRGEGTSANLDTSDSELDESSEHLPASDLVVGTAARDLDEERVVVRLHPNTITIETGQRLLSLSGRAQEEADEQ
jgi:hypothetical protein